MLLLVRGILILRRNVLHEPAEAPKKPRQEELLEEIRDLLAKQTP
jgi:large conductance mechanosensitive channel